MAAEGGWSGSGGFGLKIHSSVRPARRGSFGTEAILDGGHHIGRVLPSLPITCLWPDSELEEAIHETTTNPKPSFVSFRGSCFLLHS